MHTDRHGHGRRVRAPKRRRPAAIARVGTSGCRGVRTGTGPEVAVGEDLPLGVMNGDAKGPQERGPSSSVSNYTRLAGSSPYRIGTPDSVRAMTSRWISLVPSKMV
ncbi:hypothetical protein JCM4914_08670 [Streptomyces platensis subsp. malvinus]